MRQFYCIIEKGVAMPHQLSWSHMLPLLPLDDINAINYYIEITIKLNWAIIIIISTYCYITLNTSVTS